MSEGLALIEAVRDDPVVGPHLADLERFARPSIRLRVDRDRPRHLGETKVGGRPDVPPDFEWPTRTVEMPRPSEAWLASHSFPQRVLPEDGRSAYQFIAQIDLAAIAPFDVDGLLPRDGHLLFFYDEVYFSDVDPAVHQPTSMAMDGNEVRFHQRSFGDDQVDQVRVIRVPAGRPLRHADEGPHVPHALSLSASADRTLPNIDCHCIASEWSPATPGDGRIDLPADARSRLAELDYAHRANAGIDQMLGWADNGAHGPSMWPEIGRLTDVPLGDRLRVSEDPRLLLQLTTRTSAAVGIEFGRTLYFYALETDLRRGDFSRCWYDSD